MGYIALYRKYRPTIFADVVGQENVTSILRNQIASNKISHAYIFSGTRGTGKTSSAKIFARAINCENPINGEPCNKCASCLSILSGENTDVVEMDAASNNSVENIRQIRTEVMYASTNSKYKVYIIDEVHMLTTAAFNALLKTLEEPPENVVFILATTEQHKIPVTILSRCLRFDFYRISESDIQRRLEYVLKQENIEYEEEAVKYTAKLADGALRDGLSILDRCLSEDDKKLELQKLRQIIGSVDSEIINSLTDSIISHDYSNVIKLVESLETKGKDLRQMVYELTEVFLQKLINEEKKEYYARVIDELSKLDSDIRGSINPSIIVKATLVRIANFDENIIQNSNTANTNVGDDVLNKLKMEIIEIKNKLNEAKLEQKISYKKEEQVKVVSSSEKQPFTSVDEFKKRLSSIGKYKLFSAMAGALIKNEEDFIIITDNEFAAKMLAKEKEEIHSILKSVYGIDKQIVIKYNKASNVNKMEKLLNDSKTDYSDI